MGHAAFGGDLYAKRSFGRKSHLIFSRLAIDQKFAAVRLLVGDLCSQAVPLFTDKEQ